MLSALLPGPAEAAVFVAAVFVLNATPGVDFVLTVTRTLRGGARAGVAAALGISSGCALHALAAGSGLAALLALYPAAFVAIQWAGAAYLLWLALGMWRAAWRAAPAAVSQAPGVVTPPRLRREFMTGLMTNLLNPKVALFFLAFLPQFVPAASPHKTASFLLLAAWCVLQGTLFLLGLVAVASKLSRWSGSARARRGWNLLGGGLFVALALRLLAGRPQA